MKKIILLLSVSTTIVCFTAFQHKLYHSGTPPANFTGAPGSSGTCANCHGGSGNLNTGGGSVVISGLPDSFIPGQTYPFSITIQHPATRERWGFEIAARNTANSGIGTFSSANPNAALVGSNPSEMGHAGAVYSTGTSFTYDNLFWTAPSTISAGDNAVTFYVAANAANGTGTAGGDFIYSNTKMATLPVVMKNFNYRIIDDHMVRLDWTTASESQSKEFVLEKSDDNHHFYEIGKVPAYGTSSEARNYSFTDTRPGQFDQPVFYRLKLVDQDLKFRYSQVLQVKLKGKGVFIQSLSPNPAKSFVQAQIMADKTKQVDVSIVDAGGKVMKRRSLSLRKGMNNLQLETNDLAPGMYFLQLDLKSHVHAMSFLVQ